jgi:uncharacterized protein YjbI with pentapeptide repeats
MGANSKNDISIAKPKSIWHKEVKINFKPLFLALGKATAHTASLKFDELGVDAAEAFASLGLDTAPNELAFVLIQRSLFDAMLTLTNESMSHIEQESNNVQLLSAEIEIALNGLELKFDSDFFKEPGKLKLLEKVESIYAQWLCDSGMSPKNSKVVASRLRSYFVFSIANEWRKNSSKYSALIDSASSPFASAEEYERGWQTYFACLHRRIDENVFDEPFSLAQIYVPLNAFYVEQTKDKSKSVGAFFQVNRQVVVNLEDELRIWLQSASKADAVRVLSGGPGSGKSSFTKILCSKLANEGNTKPIYIPLHLIDPTRDVVLEVEKFVREEGLLGFNPLDPERKEEKILLVFDGLDELASQGKVAAQVTRDFVQAVERMVERRNLGQQPIHVLFSGRELVIQENETEFRRPKQILSLLPYFTPARERDEFEDPSKILNRDYRNDWWISYGRLTGADYLNMPTELSVKEIDEITSQPLLNYLVALSYNRGKLNFDKQLNLNSVYADLVGAVHERGYEKTRTYRPISHIKSKDFVRVLEEIGLAAWHGSDGRSTSVRDIMIHCQQGGLESLLATFTEGAKEGVTKLLAAFFFRRNGESAGDDAAFVFTHKSFGEYLTSARLTRGIERIVMERHRRHNSPDDGFDTTEALVHWGRLAGAAPITEYIQTFFEREIEQRSKEQVEEWHTELLELVSVVVDKHMPVEKMGILSYSKSYRNDVNASVALFIALNACSKVCGRQAKIKFKSETSFGTFLRRVCPQRLGPANPPILNALSYLDITGQCLDMADLYGVDLKHTVWNKSKVNYGNFGGRGISNAEFNGAVLSGSRFQGTSLNFITFENAQMNEVNIGYSHCRETSFKNARLSDVNFTHATLDNCDFSKAHLGNSTIHLCKSIKGCNFDQATAASEDIALIQWFNVQKALGNVTGDLIIRRIKNEEIDSSTKRQSLSAKLLSRKGITSE